MLTRICQTCVRFVIGRPVCVSVRVFVCVACLCLHIFRTQKYCLGLLQLRAPDTTYYYNYHIVITFGLSHVRISRCRHRRHQHALTHTYQRTHTHIQMDTHTQTYILRTVARCVCVPAAASFQTRAVPRKSFIIGSFQGNVGRSVRFGQLDKIRAAEVNPVRVTHEHTHKHTHTVTQT